MIKTKYFAVFHTSESNGMDICIKDSCDRMVLINTNEVDLLLEAIVAESYGGLVSVKDSFETL